MSTLYSNLSNKQINSIFCLLSVLVIFDFPPCKLWLVMKHIIVTVISKYPFGIALYGLWQKISIITLKWSNISDKNKGTRVCYNLNLFLFYKSDAKRHIRGYAISAVFQKHIWNFLMVTVGKNYPTKPYGNLCLGH